MLAKSLRIRVLLISMAFAGLAWWLSTRHNYAPLAALAAALVVFAVFCGSFVAVTFLLARLYGSPNPPGSPRGLLSLLRPWWGELACTLHTFFWRQPYFGDKALASGNAPDKPALVLVHGFLCNRAFWTGFAREFAAAGHAIESVNLEPVYGSIDDYPAIIHTAVQALRTRTGQSKVVLIGHSMGGLAIRAYLRDYGLQATRKAITLGTPHHGTWGAQLGHGKNAAQMRLNTSLRPNAWQNTLRAIETPEQDDLFEILLTHQDNIVFPQAIQTLGKAPVHEFSGMGHVQMVYARSVRAKVREILARC